MIPVCVSVADDPELKSSYGQGVNEESLSLSWVTWTVLRFSALVSPAVRNDPRFQDELITVAGVLRDR